MDDLEDGKRGIDDLIFPRKKTLTDLWREEWEKEFNLYERRNRVQARNRDSEIME